MNRARRIAGSVAIHTIALAGEVIVIALCVKGNILTVGFAYHHPTPGSVAVTVAFFFISLITIAAYTILTLGQLPTKPFLVWLRTPRPDEEDPKQPR